jgi:O-acetyl-ADP-ribose deacetylase (regulator of RNase III)
LTKINKGKVMNRILLQLRHEPPPPPPPPPLASTVIDTVKSGMDVFFGDAAVTSALLSREDMKALGDYAASKCKESYAGNPDVEIKFKALVSEFSENIFREGISRGDFIEEIEEIGARNCFKFGDTEVKIVSDDIVEMEVDAIVNAANPQLTAGLGVCGAIYDAAGKGPLAAECQKITSDEEGVRCPTGGAVATRPYHLARNGVKGIIHAVGPRVAGANPTEEEKASLYNAYVNSLDIAADKGWKSIALPRISGGIYGYPPEKQAEVACKAIIDWHEFNSNKSVKEIYFCILPNEDSAAKMYRAQLSALSRH